MRRMTIPSMLLVLFAAIPAVAATPGAGLFPPADMDTTCAPCRDFDQFANGGWKSRMTIPPAYASYGSFQMLADRNQAELDRILKAAAADKAAKAGSDTWRLGTYYSACMDSAAAEQAGAAPLQPVTSGIDAMKSTSDLAAQVAWLHQHSVRALFGMFPRQDPGNSDAIIVNIGQGGIGLPDRDYYFKTDSASVALRAAYVDHISRMLQLAGTSAAEAQSGAQRILALETALAKVSMTNVQRRDPRSQYHKLPMDSLVAMAPGFGWKTYFGQRGLGGTDTLNIATLPFFRSLSEIIAATPIADWKVYLRWCAIDDAAPTLSQSFVDEDFRFTKNLSGAKEQTPRWKRCLRATDGDLGDILGRVYVAQKFPSDARDRALKMVKNLEAALGDRIAALDWMSPVTKHAAKVKLDAFSEKIGYPVTWRDYAGIELSHSWYANRASIRAYEVKRNLAKIGKPVDRGEWGMSTPTVNAFYSPQLNSINFPAGILQPPFYDPAWDDAVNYGGIGAVIGHEMTHGFDDQGRQFDPKGNLRDWWTKDDADAYKVRSNKVAEQFNGYTVLDTLHVNGRLTLGENTADLGGLAVAYAAMEKAYEGKPRTRIDGYTPEQRFFLSYARIWRSIYRPEAERLQVLTNPHSPAHWRVNGPLSNLDEFARAFGCKDGDAMVRKQDERARLW